MTTEPVLEVRAHPPTHPPTHVPMHPPHPPTHPPTSPPTHLPRTYPRDQTFKHENTQTRKHTRPGQEGEEEADSNGANKLATKELQEGIQLASSPVQPSSAQPSPRPSQAQPSPSQSTPLHLTPSRSAPSCPLPSPPLAPFPSPRCTPPYSIPSTSPPPSPRCLPSPRSTLHRPSPPLPVPSHSRSQTVPVGTRSTGIVLWGLQPQARVEPCHAPRATPSHTTQRNATQRNATPHHTTPNSLIPIPVPNQTCRRHAAPCPTSILPTLPHPGYDAASANERELMGGEGAGGNASSKNKKRTRSRGGGAEEAANPREMCHCSPHVTKPREILPTHTCHPTPHRERCGDCRYF